MRVSGFLSGGSPVVKRYQVNASVATAGVPMKGGTTTLAGIIKTTATALVGMVGLALDTTTYSTTQLGTAGQGGGGKGAGGSAGGGASSASAYLGVIINPDVLISSRLNQGATSGTKLTQYTNTAASAGGTLLTAAVGTATMVDGTAWWASGANVNQERTVTSWVSNTSLTVTVPFDYAIAVNDIFFECPFQPMGNITTASTMQFTTDFTESRADIAVGTGAANIVCVEMFLKPLAEDGDLTSYVVWSPGRAHMLYTSTGA